MIYWLAITVLGLAAAGAGWWLASQCVFHSC